MDHLQIKQTLKELNLTADVAIRREYLHNISMKNLQSRMVIALVLSFYGDRDQVGVLMQKLSHRTRAYFVNA